MAQRSQGWLLRTAIVVEWDILGSMADTLSSLIIGFGGELTRDGVVDMNAGAASITLIVP